MPLKRYWREIIGAAVVLLSRLASLPRTPWELDEFHFIEGVRDFDPSKYHPHPPGYPLFIGLGKLVDAILDDPFRSLIVVSVVSCVIGFLALAATFRQYLGDGALAAAGALLFYLSAGMLVHSPLALADAAAMMFLFLAFYAMSRLPQDGTERRAIAAGMWTAAAIGCRPQICIPLLPAFLMCLWMLRANRLRAIAVATFSFVCLMWFVPLMDAAGGWDGLVAYEVKQGRYFVEHDAAQSRGSVGAGELVARFIAHPWGSKYVTLPLIVAIALGAAPFGRHLRKAMGPLVVFCAIHLVFALVAMDPADGVRYSLPAMTLFALIAAFGFDTVRRLAQWKGVPWMAAALFALLSWWYAKPILKARYTTPSPVAAAAEWANAHFAPGAVVLYQLGLRPQAEYLMSRFPSMSIERGLTEYFDRPDVPLWIFADGGSTVAEAKTFSWPESDAYGKLTRNVYRRVTLDPVRPAERYLPVRGVYALERTIDGLEWRWLQREAVIRTPHAQAQTVTLTFRLSPSTPYETNRIHLVVNGREAGAADARRDAAAIADVPILAGAQNEIRIVSEREFKPAETLKNRDPRTLAVQLVSIESH